LEVFWGQLNEEVQIVPVDKYRRCAQEAMKREVFAEEFADRQALKDEVDGAGCQADPGRDHGQDSNEAG
jgi:hypothetical protein